MSGNLEETEVLSAAELRREISARNQVRGQQDNHEISWGPSEKFILSIRPFAAVLALVGHVRLDGWDTRFRDGRPAGAIFHSAHKETNHMNLTKNERLVFLAVRGTLMGVDEGCIALVTGLPWDEVQASLASLHITRPD